MQHRYAVTARSELFYQSLPDYKQVAKKILLVEDNQDFAETLRIRLEANQFKVIVCNNGEEGLQSAISEKPDLVVTDLVMPVADGSQLIDGLRRNPESQDVPIILMTGVENMEQIFLIDGVTDYFLKPFEAEQLVWRIRWTLKKAGTSSKTEDAVQSVSTKAPAPTAAATPSNGPVSSPPPGDKNTILLVDDDQDLRDTLKIRLEADHFEVRIAVDGESALQEVQKGFPDLILMDVIMPKLDGFTTLKQINQITDRKVPVIMMTGTEIIAEEDFRIEGVSAFLRKPIDGRKLIQHVKEILNSSKG